MTTGFGPTSPYWVSKLAAPPTVQARTLQAQAAARCAVGLAGVRLLAEGLSNKAIAGALGISARTINFHLDNLYVKLGVTSRTEAAIYALRQGWARPNQ